MNADTLRRLNLAGFIITLLTVIVALIWAFPLYWGVITSLKPEDEVVRPYIEDALRYLRVTQDGKLWIANLYANVFSMEHRGQVV